MKDFRNKLERKVKITAIICCLFPTIYIVCKMLIKNQNDFAQGLVLGVFSGACLVCIYYLVRNMTALHDEEKLKQLYIELTDERNIAITKESLKTSSTIFVAATALVSIVAGFIDVTVCITLSAVLLLYAVITIIVQLYYKNKM